MRIKLSSDFVLACTLVIGCSGSSGSTGASDAGGTSSSGGNNFATGGAQSSGGLSSGGASALGGTLSTGGSATGGATHVGGSISTGGIPATGGAVATEGSQSTGGNVSAGGNSATGGTKASGGTLSTGGNPTTGGSKATAGGSATGGSPATGGSSSASGDCSKFSFFVTSQARLFALAQAFNGSTNGFGGDLRYGETGTGAGLRGADKICNAIAAQVCPSNGKTWHAFVSVSNDGTGAAVNAIDRVGSGPWYDRLGRLVSQTKAGLQATRPPGADAEIVNDLPNEDGVNNHAPNGTQIDNHNIMTGSTISGTLASSTGLNYSPTCKDWTDSTTGSNAGGLGPYVGNSWWDNSGAAGTNAQGWIYAGHNAAGCQPGAVDTTDDLGFGVGQGAVACPTVGCMGGYGGIYCFAVQP